MMTPRQIERNWSSGHYPRLLQDLLEARPEAQLRIDTDRIQLLSAAMAVIRLDELDQAHVPINAPLLRHILAAQESDGGWGDLTITALCLRALLTSKGAGHAVERGVQYLANLQQPEGLWPRVPIRRMPADAYTSAFILYQLGQHDAFRQSIRFSDAIAWFSRHAAELDEETRRLWQRAALGCGQPLTEVSFAPRHRMAPRSSRHAEPSLS